MLYRLNKEIRERTEDSVLSKLLLGICLGITLTCLIYYSINYSIILIIIYGIVSTIFSYILAISFTKLPVLPVSVEPAESKKESPKLKTGLSFAKKTIPKRAEEITSNPLFNG